MSKDLKGLKLEHIWEQSILRRRNSRCKGPEVGAVGLKNSKTSAWHERHEQGGE